MTEEFYPEFYSEEMSETLTGVAKLAQESLANKWRQPQSGQIAAVEFEGWAKGRSREEIAQLIGPVKKFAEEIGVPWEQINDRPGDAADRKKREAISCFAISVWRMQQLRDVHPRFIQAIDKVAELEGPQFNEERVRQLAAHIRQALNEVLSLPETTAEAKVITMRENSAETTEGSVAKTTEDESEEKSE